MFTFTKVMQAVKASASAPAGQVVLLTGTTSWVVPAGVTSISMVAVQCGGTQGSAAAPTTVTVSSVIVCRAQNGNRIGDGGGDGGTGTSGYDDGESVFALPGGGGAGGYSGNGGQAGCNYIRPPTAGAGGGGGGGTSINDNSSAASGGGVGLLGAGANGAAGTNGSSFSAAGKPGSGGSGATYGGGGPSGVTFQSSGAGGALSYKNNVAVSPGQTVTVSIPSTSAGAGAVRIIWGDGRAYPSTNTADV